MPMHSVSVYRTHTCHNGETIELIYSQGVESGNSKVEIRHDNRNGKRYACLFEAVFMFNRMVAAADARPEKIQF
jgi:hypothetical protein